MTCIVGGQVGAKVLNHVYLKFKAKNGGIGTPEMRSFSHAFPRISTYFVLQVASAHGVSDSTSNWLSDLRLGRTSSPVLAGPR